MLFYSPREKRLWIYTFIVFVVIFLTLFIGKPLASQLKDQNVQAVFFVIGLVLVASTVIVHGLKTKPDKTEWSIILGIIAVYIMLVFRLGAPERSHLMEYSILAVFIHKAILERQKNKNSIRYPALYAFVLAFLIGIIDEVLQIVLPNRVFDFQDILFNGIAVFIALGSSLLLNFAKARFSNSNNLS